MRESTISSPFLNCLPKAARHVERQARHVLANTISAGEAALLKIGTGLVGEVHQFAGLTVVRKYPPRFALRLARQSTVRSITRCGTWVPAGLSK